MLKHFFKKTWCAFLFLLTSHCFAQPNLEKLADFSALHYPESGYVFKTLHFASFDQKRHYRVYLGIPQRNAPPAGYPILYALDGNAALEYLKPQVFEALKSHPPFVLALLGYSTDLRLDAVSRAWDYTPALDVSNQHNPSKNIALTDPIHPDRQNGGADDFANLILRDIQPAIIQRVAIHSKRQTLWGHSYGGIFVLHMLSQYPHAFHQYIAADPSLWYQNAMMLKRFENIEKNPHFGQDKKLWLHQSGIVAEKSTRNHSIRNVVAREATPELAQRLQNKTALKIKYESFPQDNHGTLLGNSFLKALDIVAARDEKPDLGPK